MLPSNKPNQRLLLVLYDNCAFKFRTIIGITRSHPVCFLWGNLKSTYSQLTSIYVKLIAIGAYFVQVAMK